MYIDIGNYVRNCSKCTDIILGPSNTSSSNKSCVINDTEQHQFSTLPTDRLIRVWKKVGFKVFYCKCNLNKVILGHHNTKIHETNI